MNTRREPLAGQAMEIDDVPLVEAVDTVATARRDERIPIRWGKTIQVTSAPDHERVVLVSGTGRVELTLEITASGAKVVLDATDVELRASREVAVACDSFKVAARRFEVDAAEVAVITAQDAAITATEGDVAITANDDVKVNGERVLLNSDGELRVPGWMKAQLSATLGAAPAAPAEPATVAASDVSGDEDLLRAFDEGAREG
ncbi:hypothetical protein [Sorangium sp. So ce363]|uniref:hypothetical protein n=1 Tax=Sorangium sp. So ce363 TaxID=3133304 RepID=UPI003F5F6066